LEIPDIANCMVGKFVDLADAIRAIEVNRSALPIPFSDEPDSLYVTSLHDIIDSLFINTERLMQLLLINYPLNVNVITLFYYELFLATETAATF